MKVHSADLLTALNEDRMNEDVYKYKYPEHENEGLHYFGKQPKRRLIGYWDIMASDKRNNKARVTFRKYMALLGNKDLRCKVFGF